jgi:transcriptional regulator with XRE-family HTH domain
MKLDTYIKEAGITGMEFARRIGRSPEFVYLLISGARGPSLQTVRRISEATSGAVTADDFDEPQPRKQANGSEAAA